MKRITCSLLFLICLQYQSQGQVLISLLLGDKLNSDQIEFGMIGGASFSSLTQVEHERDMAAFMLGFYFDIKLKNAWSLAPSCLVVSKMGVRDMPTYATGDPSIDAVFGSGNLRRELAYIQVPVCLRYNLKNRIYFDLGPQVSLLREATDIFEVENGKNMGIYNRDIRDDYKRLDAGFVGGVGYSLRESKSMNFGINYYQGVVDALKNNGGSGQYNSAWYLYLTVPIGAGKAENKS
ncbi:PorT family protein [Reichenbachiella agarivorans]|uniref:PorT family protein n=1 Tax=Reichenbachiella agarivorans TaxID=2979464 RepID=A0ABY6CP76_9BACT|nr:porin family protein [Reichenbachiella agarivorans]UXP32277.1 PorT family protein [Reichenbachiella agarivorans]